MARRKQQEVRHQAKTEDLPPCGIEEDLLGLIDEAPEEGWEDLNDAADWEVEP